MNIQRSSEKSELNELKEMNTQWSGEKVALQTRLSQQEQVILALKFKLLQYEIACKSKTEEELDAVMEDHKKEMQQLHCQLATRNDIIHKQKQEIDEIGAELQTKSELESTLQSKLEAQELKVNNLQKQLHELSERMHSSRLSESSRASESSRLSDSPRLSDKACEETNVVEVVPAKSNELKVFPRDTQKVLREHKSMCTILCNIRQKLKTEGLEQRVLENIEQEENTTRTLTLPKSIEQIRNSRLSVSNSSISSKGVEQDINNRILTMPSMPRPCPPGNMNQKAEYMARSTCSIDSGYDQRLPSDPGERLKVIYYLGKSMTPVLKISDIGLGSFSLGDFKQAVNRPGKFRYFFKSVDSDFGYVREELLFDDDIVPGHDNKVVAWLERNMSDL